jgi:hypothetical protein
MIIILLIKFSSTLSMLPSLNTLSPNLKMSKSEIIFNLVDDKRLGFENLL